MFTRSSALVCRCTATPCIPKKACKWCRATPARFRCWRDAVRGASHQFKKRKREELDFSRAFWTPPLPPRQAYRLEQKQIQNTLQLPALVSLTDHDNIHAGAQLRVLSDFCEAPISTEWTVPFGPTFFHVGLHNLPVASASGIMAELQVFTGRPNENALLAILARLNEIQDLLIVLNHPLWDEKGIGVPEHSQVLGRLLERQGGSFHALEVNGLRSSKENQRVLWVGRQVDLPVVAGGDRHGLEPNSILNLSPSTDLREFIHEVRYRRRSHVLFMPQYHEPLKMRVLQTMVDIMREYPENLEGRRSWSDRVYYRTSADAEPMPLSHFWPAGNPLLVEVFVRAIRVAEFRGVRSALRFALNERRFWPDQEAAV